MKSIYLPARHLPARHLPARQWAVLLALTVFLGCNIEQEGFEHPAGKLYFPISLSAPTDDSGHLYIVNTNFDLKYDSGAVAVLDTADDTILSGGDAMTITGNFGGYPAFLRNASGALKMYIPLRYNNTVHAVTVDESGGAPTFNCEEKAGDLCGAVLPGDADGTKNFEFGDDPFAGTIYYDSSLGANVLVITEMGDGDIDFFILDDQGDVVRALKYDSSLPGMFYPIYDDTQEKLYITNKFFNVVYALKMDLSGSEPEVLYKKSISLALSYSGTDFFRKALVHDGFLYVADKHSAAVIRIDTTTDTVVEIIPAAHGVTAIDFVPPNMLTFISYSQSLLGVIDLEDGTLIKTVKLSDGPYDIKVVSGDSSVKGYFTLFSKHQIGVINLDITDEQFGQIEHYVP